MREEGVQAVGGELERESVCERENAREQKDQQTNRDRPRERLTKTVRD